jgi:hypothetical protein
MPYIGLRNWGGIKVIALVKHWLKVWGCEGIYFEGILRIFKIYAANRAVNVVLVRDTNDFREIHHNSQIPSVGRISG